MNKISGNRLLKLSKIKLQRHKSQSSAEYCLDTVKQNDYENFVCTLLLKDSARSCALAIRGFNVEVARVAEQVSQPNIGLMRLKFWEDALEKCYSNDLRDIPKHPIALELFKANRKAKLTKRYFQTLISSRKEQFNITSFNNLEDMEKYVEKSVSNVYYLILEGCGVKNVHADHAASHLGKAQGIVQQIRSIPHTKRINFITIPRDILYKHNISQEELLRLKSSQKLNDCVYEVASRAHQHLTKARSLLESVPKEGRAALLPAVFVDEYLMKIQRFDYDPLHPALTTRSFRVLPRLWLTNYRNRF